MKTLRLGVNIDHIATLRQMRKTIYPDPLEAAMIAIKSGADGITLHLREDRRHIQDQDVYQLKKILTVPMNLEMAATEEMVHIAEAVKPEHCCLVPEKREELTTEGGLDVARQVDYFTKVCKRLEKAGIEVSLFIDAEKKQIDAAKACGASTIEIHTGHYADAKSAALQQQWLDKIREAVQYAHAYDLIVNAGHGLTLENAQPIAAIPEINELNIGHSIISRAVFVGLAEAVREMKALIIKAHN